MAKPKLIETRDVPLEAITVDLEDRLRPASDASVSAVMASVEELGHALTPIMLRRKGTGKNMRLVLIGGLHRYEAYKRLGRETIRADIWTCTDDWARLAQIDENLAGADLDTLELATFLADRKRVYEKLHPETKRGSAGAVARWDDDATDIVSFASSIAEKRDMSDRHVRRLVRIGERLSTDTTHLLRMLDAPLGYNDLAALAECEQLQQVDAARRMLDEDRPKAKDAIRAAKGEVVRPKLEHDPVARPNDLMERFTRLKVEEQRIFIQRLIEHKRVLVMQELEAINAEGDA